MKRYALLLLGAGLLLGCQKDDILFVKTNSALAQLSQTNGPAVQRFVFALNQPQTLRTTAGATLSFPANAFRLPDGRTQATGQAELRVREIYSVADMVLANMPTTAHNGEHLVSGGEFNIQVWQGSTRLRLGLPAVANGTAPRLLLTSPVPPTGLDTTRMLLWQLPANAFAATAPDSSGWSWPAGNGGPTWLAPPTGGFYSAALPLDSIGWWNIDQFWHAYRTSGTGGVFVEVPVGATETRVYFRPVGYNGLARCVATPSTTRWASNLPIGADVIAVVLQERSGQLYYGTQRLTTQAGLVVSPTLQALSEADIVQRIRQL
ncbi:MAG: hypothetical protein JWR44_1478 [Hymenobacter sp.]|jgi:hypothetical protein|nr:hypothetical protein [Hymenobacter sp.]